MPPAGWSFYRNASKGELDRYNKKLHEFFGQYDRYLRKFIAATNWQERTRSLLLTLNNTGSKPAEDIDIAITFPAGIEVISDDDFKALPTVPTPPDRPGEDAEPEYSTPELSEDSSQVSNSKILEIIKSTNEGFQVKFFVQRVKHTFSESLPLLDFHFPPGAELKSFQFKYRIVAGNCPEPFEGVLNVKLTIIADNELVESHDGGAKGSERGHKRTRKGKK